MKLPAKKSLGQHFLNSKHVLGQIIEAAHITSGEQVLEIGPGTGILTDALLQSGANVIAVEKDARAIPLLHEKYASYVEQSKLKIIQGDILSESLIISSLLNDNFALIANIPYYITGAILEKFLEHGPRPNRMVLLVQKEVADRIVARDGKESILSISVKAFGTPKIIAKVPPGAFTPPPSVDSAILAIENVSDEQFKKYDIVPLHFFSIVKAGFAHKRKVLKKNLEVVLHPSLISDIWSGLKLSDTVRAEDVPMETWFGIAGTKVKKDHTLPSNMDLL